MISCGCHYAYFNIDRNTMEEKHPDIFYDGLPDHMAEQYDAYIQPQLIPWTGYWPGVVECSAYGLWAKWTAHGWQRCDSSHPEATEDLNTLAMMGRWNKEQKRFVLREEFLAVLALRERKAVTE